MRRLFLILALSALCLVTVGSGASQAQFYPYGYYPGGYYYPGLYSPSYPLYNYNYAYRYTPYGYRSFYSVNTLPDVFGNYAYQYGYNYSRPYMTGPWHSVYFDPYLNRYVFVPR
jgi:hypothetical protein